MNRLEFISTQPPEVKKQLLQQAAKDYAFTVYLRKGIHIDPGVFVKDILEDWSKKYSVPLEDGTTEEVPEPSGRWEDLDFLIHFYFGRSREVSLEEIGHLQDVIRVAEGVVYPKFITQIQEYLQKNNVKNMYFTQSFRQSHDFSSVHPWHGHSIVSGEFSGETAWRDRKRVFSGIAKFEFI